MLTCEAHYLTKEIISIELNSSMIYFNLLLIRGPLLLTKPPHEILGVPGGSQSSQKRRAWTTGIRDDIFFFFRPSLCGFDISSWNWQVH